MIYINMKIEYTIMIGDLRREKVIVKAEKLKKEDQKVFVNINGINPETYIDTNNNMLYADHGAIGRDVKVLEK